MPLQLTPLYTASCRDFISDLLVDAISEDCYQKQILGLMSAYYQANAQDFAGGFEFLPSIICQALFPPGIERAIPFTAAWQFIRLAAKIFDDVEDGEIREAIPETINLATGCLFAAQFALSQLTKFDVSRDKISLVMERLAQLSLRACAGQHADLTMNKNYSILDPDGWLKIASLKSGELFAWAAWAGAVAASENMEIQSKFLDFGQHLGIIVQIADDFVGLWGKDGGDDLTQGKSSLPICYARLVVRGQEREILEQCLTEASLGNLESSQTAREIITRLGGQSFLISTAWLERQKAVNALNVLPLSLEKKEALFALFDNVFPALTHFPYESSTPLSLNSN